MAKDKDKKPKDSALARLVPNSISVTMDGTEVRVATDKGENAILNMVMAGQMRAMLQEQMKRYKEEDRLMTPKELKELSEAAANISKFSGEIYNSSSPIEPAVDDGEKKAEKADSIDDIDFGKMSKPIDVTPENKA